MKIIPVLLAIVLLFSGMAFAQDAAPNLVGTWQGTLNVGAASLRLGLHITRSDTGTYSATLDSIDQGASGIPVRETTVTGTALHLDMPNLRATYEGTLSADGNTIAGTFTQVGMARVR